MKKIFLSMLAMAALAGCSKDESTPNGTQNPDELAPIVLRSGVSAASRAPIVDGSKFDIDIVGWETAAAVDYSQDATWISAATDVTASATALDITMTPQQFYNSEAATTTYIRAWAPKTGTKPASGGLVTFTNTDGSVDAMLAGAVTGSKANKGAKALVFDHKTTQLVFKVIGGDGLAAGTTLTSIAVKNAELPTGFNLVTNTATFAAADDLSVSGISSLAIPAKGGTSADAGKPVMIKPMTGKKVMLDIVTSGATFNNVEAEITDENFAEGKAYTITLTFTQANVSLTASVTEWTVGTGAGTVE